MNRSALIIIDTQKGIDHPAHGERNNPQAEANIAKLLAHWRKRRLPIVHIQHDSIDPESVLRPGLPGHAFKEEAMPLDGETVYHKTVNSAFEGTPLELHLQQQEIESVVIVGMTTDHCVSASTRSASDRGFGATVIADATATHERIGVDGRHYSAELMHQINLASLNEEFCRVLTTEALLAEMA